MGGNALKHTHGLESKRMNVEEYNHLKDFLTEHLDKIGIVYRHTVSYRNKIDFGDIDIVVSREDDSVDKIRHWLKSIDAPMTNEFTMQHTTNFLNTIINEYQVDFVIVEPEQVESATTYYSYNDIWNLLGKVIKTHDYKLGWQGLLYTYRNGNHYKEDIVLTYDLMEALSIMGLDVERYKLGFDDYNDMFDFVISCKAFDKSKFALENLNHRNRVRDKKRKTYNLFLSYINDNDYPEPIALTHPMLVFPHLNAEIKKRDDMFRDKNRAKEIINGHVISKITGLQNRDVKYVIEDIRNNYTVDDILKFTDDDVYRIIMDSKNKQVD